MITLVNNEGTVVEVVVEVDVDDVEVEVEVLVEGPVLLVVVKVLVEETDVEVVVAAPPPPPEEPQPIKNIPKSETVISNITNISFFTLLSLYALVGGNYLVKLISVINSSTGTPWT